MTVIILYIYIYFPVALWPSAGHGPPHSWGFYITNNDTPQLARLLWTSDQIITETSTWHTQHSQQTNTHSPWRELSRRVAADPCLRRHGHWDWRNNYLHRLSKKFWKYHMEHTRQATQKTCWFYQSTNLKRLKTTNVQHLAIKFWCTQL